MVSALSQTIERMLYVRLQFLQNHNRGTVPWREPLYWHVGMPSLERVDRDHTEGGGGGMNNDFGNPPGPKTFNILPWGRDSMEGRTCQVPP